MKKRKPIILAIIAARGGSKRVKNKNLKKLGGKPLLAHTIDAALRSPLIDRVLVSTDSVEIARVAEHYDADVPFLRPKEISQADSTEFEFHAHALGWLDQHEGYVPDLIVNLYPTSPFRTTASIERAIKLMLANPKADSLRSVRRCSEHPFKMWVQKKGAKKWLEPFDARKSQSMRTLSYHLLPPVYIQNASIYITKPATLARYGSTIGRKVVCFEMSEEESVDINTELDFEFAQMMMMTRMRKRRR